MTGARAAVGGRGGGRAGTRGGTFVVIRLQEDHIAVGFEGNIGDLVVDL